MTKRKQQIVSDAEYKVIRRKAQANLYLLLKFLRLSKAYLLFVTPGENINLSFKRIPLLKGKILLALNSSKDRLFTTSFEGGLFYLLGNVVS